ncbi:MAG TPA: FlgD immunoglobulin-like domain containing protein, partial [bacterium]|nr:FlgD immunoglobulin-like domain containing protein [bacterium]
PWDWYGNIDRFYATFDEGEIASHAIRWLSDRVECRSWRGGPNDETPGNMIHTWTYAGPHVPRPEQPRIHINLWQINGEEPASPQEVVLDAFNFFPADLTGVDDPTDGGQSTERPARLLTARPNPFSPATTIGYSLREGTNAEIAVFDLAGRRVRTLVKGSVPAGEHEAVWDGLDDHGRPAASGVYFCRLRAGDALETRRMVLVR